MGAASGQHRRIAWRGGNGRSKRRPCFNQNSDPTGQGKPCPYSPDSIRYTKKPFIG
jgi:hypothetical protein